MWRWRPGRQDGKYEKLLLATSKWLKFDCYLLWFHQGCEVPPHRDPVKPGYRHHRLNITLKMPFRGGEVYVNGPCRQWFKKRIMLFRPDVHRHGMTKPHSPMMMLSIGWLTKIKW